MEAETPEQRIDRLIDEHLARVADGEAPDLEAALSGIEEPELREAFLVGVLAEEYIQRVTAGEDVAVEEVLDRMESDEGREKLRQYVLDSRRAGRFLPRGLTAGTVLAVKYRIVREIGRGGMAIVYAAVDENLQHEVAIKVFNRDASPDRAEGWEEHVRRESQVLASLTSRNIVTIHAAEHVGEHSFIVMDLVSGCDVHQVIEKLRGAERDRKSDSRSVAERVARLEGILGCREEGEHEDLLVRRSWYRTVARIVQRAAHALELAHGAGVLHRDLKPQNLVLVPGGEPVLLDFGLAAGRNRGASLDEGGLFGTLEYLAPEQVRTFRTGSDPRTDLYQLGLVLHELLTLRPAFERSADEPIEWILGRKRAGGVVDCAELDPRIPPVLAAICRHALAPEIDHRYRSAREMRVDLARFEAGLPPRFAPFAAARAAVLWLSHWGRKPAVAASVAFVMILTAVMLWRSSIWVPPALTPFRKEVDAALELLTRGQTIEARDDFVLGIEVSASSPLVLYAFEIEGDGEGPDARSLTPVAPELYGLREQPEEASYSLELAPGRHNVVCSYVDDNPRSFEGILVYALEKDDPKCALFEEWQNRLRDQHERDRELFANTYAQALAIGATLFAPGGRGVSGTEVSAEQRRRLFGSAEDSEDVSEDGWRELGFLREEFVFRVEIVEIPE